MNRPVLLIHGLGSSYEHNFRDPGVEAILEDSGREVVAVELPGHGAHPHGPGPVVEAAGYILDRARAQGDAAGVDAVGFSAGGYALLVAASRAPDLFAHIAVLGVADAGLQDNRVDAGGMDAIADVLEAETAPPPGMAAMIRRLADSAGNDRTAVARYARSAQPAPSLEMLRALTSPCLIIEGGADLTGPADSIEQALPRAHRLVLPGADHFSLPSDVRCLTAVIDFLDTPVPAICDAGSVAPSR